MHVLYGSADTLDGARAVVEVPAGWADSPNIILAVGSATHNAGTVPAVLAETSRYPGTTLLPSRPSNKTSDTRVGQWSTPWSIGSTQPYHLATASTPSWQAVET